MEPVDSQPPKTREEIAMSKVRDPFTNAFSPPYPLWHGTLIEKLPDILREGIISEGFANRIGKKKYHRSFDALHNTRYVSLERGHTMGNDYPFANISVLVEPTGEVIDTSRIPSELLNAYAPWRTELCVENRISPRELKGLQIRKEEDLDRILAVMREVDPTQALPVYFKDGLVWPEKLTREQLRDRVQLQS